MRVFRRSNAGASDSTAEDSSTGQSQDATAKSKPPAEAGKGRPTPKRSEAERTRYKMSPDDKARARSERDRRMSAMKRGEEWALGPRDRGPIKKLARDYVDSHRRPSEYYMYVLVVLLVALLSRNAVLNTYVSPLVLVLIVVVVIDGYLIRRAIHRLAAERYPGESTRGITTYAVMRALQIRRFRMPAPRLKPGDEM